MSAWSPHAAVRARAALVALLAVALFVEVNVLSAEWSSAADWSRGSMYTLSGRTRRVLESLDREVGLTVIVSEAAEARGAGRAEVLRRLLERYAAVTRRVGVRTLDPDRDPVEVAMLVGSQDALRVRAGVEGGRLPDAERLESEGRAGGSWLGVLVQAGERAAFRPLDELFPAPAADRRSSSAPLAVESGITSAILDVTAPDRAVICFTDGHGEWDLAGPEGEALLRGYLEGDAYELRTLDAASLGEGLERCTVTAIVGPSRGFLPREASALRSRLERGGRLLVMLDAHPDAGGDAALGLGPLLARAGMEVSAGAAKETDPARLYQPGSPNLVVGSVSGSLESARELAGQPIAVLLSAGVRGLSTSAAITPVIESAESITIDGWGSGALLGAAADAGEGGRIVVFGASSILFPPFAARPQTANLALVLSTIAWLSGRSSALPPPPVAAERVRLFLQAGTLRWLWWWLVVGMPVGAGLGGFIVGRVRRRASR
ncbi:MAG: Gldg family protein [Deltaproteobacteria bacterium]|nr:Gldg family protein [Deltaproteobacteria bacterium]